VREGSRLSAGDFAAALKGNANVPAWLSKAIGAKGGALTAGKVAAPKDRIWLFVEPLLAAFKAGGWDITTATSKIAVTRAKGKEDWRQEVLPDLKTGERLGAILHEIAIHAGRIAQGLPDTHDDTSAVIEELVDQIGAFFRATGSGGALEQSPLTKEILAFVAAN